MNLLGDGISYPHKKNSRFNIKIYIYIKNGLNNLLKTGMNC